MVCVGSGKRACSRAIGGTQGSGSGNNAGGCPSSSRKAFPGPVGKGFSGVKGRIDDSGGGRRTGPGMG
jgi:hypothetical protein